MAAGMGLAMAPATESIMGALPPEQAGVGSAVNDTTREIGGVLGVAILGSIANAGYVSNLGDAAAHLPAPAADAANSSLAGALTVAHQAPAAIGHPLALAAQDAFVRAADRGVLVAAIVAVAGALFAWRALPARAAGHGACRARRVARYGRVDAQHRRNVNRLSADERREAVLDAAVHEFAHAGYHAASTTSIAKRAGISQPYIYALFPNKKALFIAVQERVSKRIRDAFVEAADGARGSEDRVERMGEAYKGLLDDRDHLLAQLHGFAAASDPEIREPVAACFAETFDTIARLIGGTPRRPGRSSRWACT